MRETSHTDRCNIYSYLYSSSKRGTECPRDLRLDKVLCVSIVTDTLGCPRCPHTTLFWKHTNSEGSNFLPYYLYWKIDSTRTFLMDHTPLHHFVKKKKKFNLGVLLSTSFFFDFNLSFFLRSESPLTKQGESYPRKCLCVVSR